MASKNSFIDMTGTILGRLTVLRRSPQNTAQGTARWECQCECGRMVTISGGVLRIGDARSCGCQRYLTRRMTRRKHAIASMRQTSRVKELQKTLVRIGM